MGGNIGPADTAGTRHDDGSSGSERRPSPIGKGDTANVAGSAEQQPEIAQGPVPGVQPGERFANPAHRPPLSIDPPGPPRPAAEGTQFAEDLDDSVTVDPERTEPHDPGAEPEDEGIPDLDNGSPSRRWSQDPELQPVPVDSPVAAESFGTTGAEQAAGQSLDARLAQEEPDIEAVGAEDSPEPPAGSLVEDDPHCDLTGEATGDEVGLSAEERAMHIRADDAELPPDE
ncbi:hypothetical protein [Kitasatospora sp. GP82]|uniref:hypothetical protein n=1 Tax=Kitasatospora sp. GP82 TaxID=3035089 RepID=UPI00247350C5|nr:hypothetical protein [Kitasatospora sp. GP82]